MKILTLVLILLAGCSHPRLASPQSHGNLVPGVDYHVHLRSADDSVYIGDGSSVRTAKDLVSALDAAGIRKALVASTAYFFGAPDVRPDPSHDEYTRVRAENDWVAAQVAEYPSRLVGFCSVNPLRDYARREIARCHGIGLHGLKLHLANARVDLQDTADVRKVRGARDARIFIENVLSAAPDVPVQLAHLAGWGSYDQGNDDSLGEFIAALKGGEIERTHLYFDLAAVYIQIWHGIKLEPSVTPWTPVIAGRLREIGLDHVLFGTDWPGSGYCQSQSAIATFLVNDSGLTLDEVRRVFANVAPYMR